MIIGFLKKIKRIVQHKDLSVLKGYILLYIYNKGIDLFRWILPKKTELTSGPSELQEIRLKSKIRTDISDHLLTIYEESMAVKPKIIIELGVRGGESTFVLERVAKLNDADIISVDIEDFTDVSQYPKWHFVKSDDVKFADEFVSWCKSNGLKPEIDVLFIDTSHYYEHTVYEIRAWFGFLKKGSKVMFHDTNMYRFFTRRDGSRGYGWDSERGVIRAIETYLEEKFNESKNFRVRKKGWLITHHSYCNGLTILKKLE